MLELGTEIGPDEYEDDYVILSLHNVYCICLTRSYRRSLKAVPYVAAVTILVLSLFCAGSVFAHSEPAQGGGYVHGWVYGFTYNNYLIPISWANVTASNGQWAFRAATSMNGGFQMFLPAGTYSLTASEPGYVSYSMVVSVSDGSSSSINFYLDESHVPIPEFQPQLLSIVIVLCLAAVTLAKRKVKHAREPPVFPI